MHYKSTCGMVPLNGRGSDYVPFMVGFPRPLNFDLTLAPTWSVRIHER